MKQLLILTISILFICKLSAQDQQNFEYSFESVAFGEERTISVFLPDKYNQNAKDSFAVIYMLDAQSSSVWNMAKSNINYLVNQHQIIPTIVVGIHTKSRQKEFLPQSRSDKIHPANKNGTAHLLHQHLTEEIFPLISKEYRINEFKALIGHSRAGFFVAHTLFSNKSDLFNAYLMISPGLHYLNHQILNDADSILQSKTAINKFFFCSIGDLGSTDLFFEPYVDQLDSMIQSYPNESLSWKLLKLEDSNHFTGVIPSINDGLVEMSRNYMLTDFHIDKFSKNNNTSMQSQIEAHYNKSQAQLKFAISPKSSDIRYFGNELREDGKEETAWELYKYALHLDPDDFRTYRTMGWAYMDKEDNVQASKYLNLSIKKLESQKAALDKVDFDRMLAGIKRSLKEIEEREK